MLATDNYNISDHYKKIIRFTLLLLIMEELVSTMIYKYNLQYFVFTLPIMQYNISDDSIALIAPY